MKITFEASISAGKSTLLSRLQQDTRLPIFLEPIDKWTLLNKFYENQSRYAFPFNTEVLLSMANWKNNTYDSLYERSPLSCRWIFTQLQYESGDISKEELDIFDKLYNTFGWDQDVIIYIYTDPKICYERMKKRNRGCEESVSLDYLTNLHRKHEDMLEYIKKNKTNVKIYTIDGNLDEDTVYNKTREILKDLINI
jgi:deoxyadenosine/deoxycytidine kinase